MARQAKVGLVDDAEAGQRLGPLQYEHGETNNRGLSRAIAAFPR
jgi:hypothetical protein